MAYLKVFFLRFFSTKTEQNPHLNTLVFETRDLNTPFFLHALIHAPFLHVRFCMSTLFACSFVTRVSLQVRVNTVAVLLHTRFCYTRFSFTTLLVFHHQFRHNVSSDLLKQFFETDTLFEHFFMINNNQCYQPPNSRSYPSPLFTSSSVNYTQLLHLNCTLRQASTIHHLKSYLTSAWLRQYKNNNNNSNNNWPTLISDDIYVFLSLFSLSHC